MPMEAVMALFDQKPDIDGTGLAGIAIDTPCTPRPQDEPYEVFAFTDQGHKPSIMLSVGSGYSPRHGA